MNDPVIISSYNPGLHSVDLDATISRLDREVAWADLSTIIITPAGKSIPTTVMTAWEAMICPPNNKIVRLTTKNMEVGEAYSNCIEAILAHPDISSWKYICTREHDNAMPPDGLIKLLRQMEAHPEYAVIGGLYFTKGSGGLPTGVAQIWGDVNDPILNFRPQKPDPKGGLKPCYGAGMGFTLFRTEMFKDKRLRRPWFKTPSSKEEGAWTQDLYFAADMFKHGYKAAVDCSVRVGHYNADEDIMY